MWLNETHPIATPTGCTDVDVYKYGLSGGFPGYALDDYNSLGREGIIARYRARKANYAWGLVIDHALFCFRKGLHICRMTTHPETPLVKLP